jgi:hypothetical protein
LSASRRRISHAPATFDRPPFVPVPAAVSDGLDDARAVRLRQALAPADLRQVRQVL